MCSVTALRGHTLAQLSTQQQLLLRWLVLHPKRPAGGITHTSIEQLRRKLPSFTGVSHTRLAGASAVQACLLRACV